jgi:hypothetical protein
VAASGLPPNVQVADTPTTREVEAAYGRFLQVYGDAAMNLDTAHLNEVLDGQALQWVTEEINGLKAGGRPVKIIVDNHQIAFGPVSDNSATLIDEYLSRSVYADPVTKEPLPRTGPPNRVRQSYEFRKIGGVWKIVDGSREDLGEASG